MKSSKNNFLYILGLIARILKYALLVFIGLLIILLAVLASNYRDFTSAYRLGLQGKNELMTAVAQTQTKNWDAALSSAQTATKDFSGATEKLEASRQNIAVKKIVLLQSQVNDLEYLLKTAEIISRSLERALPLAKGLSQIQDGAPGGKFSDLPDETRAEFLKLVYESEPEIQGLKANLNLALLNINKIRKVSILWPLYGKISEYKSQLENASSLLSSLTPLVKLLPVLGGYPTESNLLIIMQNNDELRPGGGFIGVFGLLKSYNGKIISLDTHDSYHLDMPAVGQWQMEPPAPIKKYMKVENWYLRDANWSPDWPTSAKKIEEIYYGESRAIVQTAPEFAGVIGITPDFVASLLKLVGPIEEGGVIYNQENFQSLLQYNVEVAYKEQEIPSWERKQVINDLLEELKTKLLVLEASKLPELLNIFENSLKMKDLQIYFNNENYQAIAAQLGADGAVKKTDSDYLLVVDANLAAYKSDAVVKKTIDYTVEESAGKLNSDLKIGYRHEGGFDWRTTRYRSYTRVYVPRGSQLISVKALGQVNLEVESISSFEDKELDKTVFGFFFSVEPGTNGTIDLKYTLPDNIKNDSNYNLLVQKQAGRRTEALRVNIDLGKIGKNSWTSDLKNDELFQ